MNDDKDDDAGQDPFDKALSDQFDQLDDQNEDGDDGGGLDAPIVEQPDRDIVPMEKGYEAVREARQGTNTVDPTKADEKPTDDPENKADDGKKPIESADPAQDSEADSAPKEATDAEKPVGKYDAIVAAAPETEREAIIAKLSLADEIEGLVALPHRQEALRAANMTSTQAIDQLLTMQDYAQRDIHGYIGHVAVLAGGKDKAVDQLIEAGKKLGYDLTIAEPETDDDFFADPAQAEAAKAEAARQRQEALAALGPHSPEFQQQQAAARMEHDISVKMSATDNSGKPLYPHFNDPRVQQVISIRAQEFAAINGRMPTIDDLPTIYTQVADQLFPPQTPAANAQGDVQEQSRQQAAAVDKAKRAMKTTSATSQGARTTQPSAGPKVGESLDDILAHAYEASSG